MSWLWRSPLQVFKDNQAMLPTTGTPLLPCCGNTVCSAECNNIAPPLPSNPHIAGQDILHPDMQRPGQDDDEDADLVMDEVCRLTCDIFSFIGARMLFH
jgi:hypothetical protein